MCLVIVGNCCVIKDCFVLLYVHYVVWIFFQTQQSIVIINNIFSTRNKNVYLQI